MPSRLVLQQRGVARVAPVYSVLPSGVERGDQADLTAVDLTGATVVWGRGRGAHARPAHGGLGLYATPAKLLCAFAYASPPGGWGKEPGACVVHGVLWWRGLHVGVSKDGWTQRHSGMQLGLHEEKGGGSAAHCASW